jgi:hypothetical protein
MRMLVYASSCINSAGLMEDQKYAGLIEPESRTRRRWRWGSRRHRGADAGVALPSPTLLWPPADSFADIKWGWHGSRLARIANLRDRAGLALRRLGWTR